MNEIPKYVTEKIESQVRRSVRVPMLPPKEKYDPYALGPKVKHREWTNKEILEKEYFDKAISFVKETKNI